MKKKKNILIPFYDEIRDFEKFNGQLTYMIYYLNQLNDKKFHYYLVGLDTGVCKYLKQNINHSVENVSIVDLSQLFTKKSFDQNDYKEAEYKILKKPIQHFIVNESMLKRLGRDTIKCSRQKHYQEKALFYTFAWNAFFEKYRIDAQFAQLDALLPLNIMYQICLNRNIPAYFYEGGRVEGYFNMIELKQDSFFQLPRFNKLYQDLCEKYEQNGLSDKEKDEILETSQKIRDQVLGRTKPYKISSTKIKPKKYTIFQKIYNLFSRLVDDKFQLRSLLSVSASVYELYEGIKYYKDIWKTPYRFAKAARFVNKHAMPKQKFDRHIKNNKYLLFIIPFQSEANNVSPFPDFNIFDALRDLALSCPSDTKIVIKDHPLQKGKFHFEDFKSVYDKFEDKIVLAPYEANLIEILKNAEYVVAANNTTVLEALNLNIPVISFGNAFFVKPELCHIFSVGEIGKLTQLLISKKQKRDEFYVDILNYAFVKSAYNFHLTYSLSVVSEADKMQQLENLQKMLFTELT